MSSHQISTDTDTDGDGLTDDQEVTWGTNPSNQDSDSDGLTDGYEIFWGTDPLNADTDGDELADGQEIIWGTDPRYADTDGDGLTDGIDPAPGSAPSATPLPTDFGTTFTPTTTPKPQTETPNPTLTLQAAYQEVDHQFENLLKANLAFNKPEKIKIDIPVSVELILNPSLSESDLAAQLIEQSDFVTSTADPSILVAPSGESVTIETSQIEITPRMKAVLLARDPDAFMITEMHDNPEQAISSVDTTQWRWSVTAKKEGTQTLELVVYQLVQYDEKEFWHEVTAYKADIVVEVTISSWVKSLDWKWLASAILIPLFIAAWGWLRNKNKKVEADKPIPTLKKNKKK